MITIKRYILTGLIINTSIFSISAQQWNGSSDASGNLWRSGNVGIGTSTPYSVLDIIGTYSSTSLDVNSYSLAAFRSGGHVQVAVNAQLAYPHTISFQGKHSTANGNAYPLALNPLGGNVGIGTNNPQSKLDVAGNIRFGLDGTYNLLSGPAAGGAIRFGSNSQTWDRNLQLGFISNDFSFASVISLIHLTGYVGIGTANPAAKLHIENGENTDAAILATSSENNKLVVSSGTTQPVNVSTFKISQQFADNRNNGYISFHRGGGTGGGFLSFGTFGLERVRFETNGNVLIGKISQTNTDYKLDVDGKIRANEIVVNSTGADFVFAHDYKLPSLSEVEKFITENNHLPGITLASDMQEKGMNVSEMQTILLQKIEELTLYVIDQNKRIELLELENRELKK